MGSDHPIMWQHVYDGGRSWYTAMGHTISSYSVPLFRSMLLGGILWAAGYDLPSFGSVSTRLAAGRLTVTASHPNCDECVLTLRSGGVTTRAAAAGTRTAVTSVPLPAGRRRYSLVLTDERMRAHVTKIGFVSVS